VKKQTQEEGVENQVETEVEKSREPEKQVIQPSIKSSEEDVVHQAEDSKPSESIEVKKQTEEESTAHQVETEVNLAVQSSIKVNQQTLEDINQEIQKPQEKIENQRGTEVQRDIQEIQDQKLSVTETLPKVENQATQSCSTEMKNQTQGVQDEGLMVAETQTDSIQKRSQATETQSELSPSRNHPDVPVKIQPSPVRETSTKETGTDSLHPSNDVEIQTDLIQKTEKWTQQEGRKLSSQELDKEEEKTPSIERGSRASVEPHSEKDLTEKEKERESGTLQLGQKRSTTVPPISHYGGIGLLEKQPGSSSNSLGAIETPKFFDHRTDIANDEASPSQDYLNSQNPRSLRNQIIEEEKQIKANQVKDDNEKDKTIESEESLSKAEKSQTQGQREERRIFNQGSFSIKETRQPTAEQQSAIKIQDSNIEQKEDKEISHETIQGKVSQRKEDLERKSPEKVTTDPVSITVTPPKDHENKKTLQKQADDQRKHYEQHQQDQEELEFEYNEEDYRDQNYEQGYGENNRRLAAGVYFPGGQSRITNLHTVEEEEDVMGTRESYQPSPKAFEESRDSAHQHTESDYLNVHQEEVNTKKPGEVKIEDEIEKISNPDKDDSGSVIIADFENSYEADQENTAHGDKAKGSDARDYNKRTLEELIGGEVSSIVDDIDPSHQDRVNTSTSNEKNIIPRSLEFFKKSSKSQNEIRKDSEDIQGDEEYARDDSNISKEEQQQKSRLGKSQSNRGSEGGSKIEDDRELYKTPIKTSSVSRLGQPEELIVDLEHSEKLEQDEDIDVQVVDSEATSQAGPGSVEDRFGVSNRDEIVGQIPESIRETFGKSGKKVVVAKIPQILTLSELTKKILIETQTENPDNTTPVRERRDNDEEREERKEFESPFSYHYADNADNASSQGYPTPERSFIPKQESVANSNFDSPIKKLIDAANQKTEKLSNILSTVDRIIEGNKYSGGDQNLPNVFSSGGPSIFNQNFSKGIPVPSPSKYVKTVRRNQIDQIPLSESFHHTGQTSAVANRQRSMSYNPNNSAIHLDASYLSANFAIPKDRNLSFIHSNRGDNSLQMDPNEKLE